MIKHDFRRIFRLRMMSGTFFASTAFTVSRQSSGARSGFKKAESSLYQSRVAKDAREAGNWPSRTISRNRFWEIADNVVDPILFDEHRQLVIIAVDTLRSSAVSSKRSDENLIDSLLIRCRKTKPAGSSFSATLTFRRSHLPTCPTAFNLVSFSSRLFATSLPPPPPPIAPSTRNPFSSMTVTQCAIIIRQRAPRCGDDVRPRCFPEILRFSLD